MYANETYVPIFQTLANDIGREKFLEMVNKASVENIAQVVPIMAKDLPNSPWAELNTVGIIVCSSIHWLAAQNTILANGLKRRFNIFGTLANNSPCLAKSCSASACNGGQTAHFCKIKSCCINIGPH